MELLALWKTMRHAHGSSSENLLQTDSTGTLFQCRLPFPAVLDRKTEFQSVWFCMPRFAGGYLAMHRVYNFSAGPAVLPEEVLQEAAAEMMDYKGTGMSVMEMSHRSAAFDEIIKTAEQDLRDLMGIPDNYKVLFLQGGASQQFAAVPMNLMKNGVADYIVTGQWAKKAYQEAQKYGKAVKIASSEDKTFSYIPDCSDLPIDEDADYVYICENNTIYGKIGRAHV